MTRNFPAVLNLIQPVNSFSNSTGSFVTNCRFSPIIDCVGIATWHFEDILNTCVNFTSGHQVHSDILWFSM
jgi:hypothetical protein